MLRRKPVTEQGGLLRRDTFIRTVQIDIKPVRSAQHAVSLLGAGPAKSTALVTWSPSICRAQTTYPQFRESSICRQRKTIKQRLPTTEDNRDNRASALSSPRGCVNQTINNRTLLKSLASVKERIKLYTDNNKLILKYKTSKI